MRSVDTGARRSTRELTAVNWIIAVAIVASSIGLVALVSILLPENSNPAFGAIVAGGFVASGAYLTVVLKQREEIRERQLMEHEIWQSGVRLTQDSRTEIAGWETLQGYVLEYPQGHLRAAALVRLAAQYLASDGDLETSSGNKSGADSARNVAKSKQLVRHRIDALKSGLDCLVNKDYRSQSIGQSDDCNFSVSLTSEELLKVRRVRRPDVIGFRGATIPTEYEFRDLVVPRGMTLDFSHTIIPNHATLRFVDCRVEGAIDLTHSDIQGLVEFRRIVAPWVERRSAAIDLREAKVSGEVLFDGMRSTKGAKARTSVVELSSVLIEMLVVAGRSSDEEDQISHGRITIAGDVDGKLLFRGEGVVSRSSFPISLRGSTWRNSCLDLAVTGGVHPGRVDASNVALESASIHVSVGRNLGPSAEGSSIDLSRMKAHGSEVGIAGLSLERIDALEWSLAGSRVVLSGIEFLGDPRQDHGCFVDVAVSEWDDSLIEFGGHHDADPCRLGDGDLVFRVDAPVGTDGSSGFAAVVDEQGQGRVQFALNDEPVVEADEAAHSVANAAREGTLLSWAFSG